MKKLDLVVLLWVLTFFAGQSGFAGDRIGIDCGCDEVGTYNVLSKGTLPDKVIISVDEGTSQNGTYEYTVGAVGSQVILTVRVAGGAQLVSEIFTPFGEAHWGFSPDEHRFVYHYLDNMSRHYVRLFDLEDGGTLINENGYGHITGDSELYFSPHGHYFFYAAKVAATRTFLSIVNVGESPYEVHELTLGLVLDPANKSGLAAWGFNKKIKDAAATTDAAFLYAYKTSSTNVTWRLIDLATMTVHAEDSVTSGTWWGFSPCGDVLGLIESDTKSVRLVRTIDGVDLYDRGYSDTAAQLSSSPAEHLLNGQSLSPAVPNTAGSACPGPPDTEAPTWPTDPLSTVEASAITGTSLTLSWSEAEDNLAVTQYQVYQDGQSIALLDASVQTCDVDALSPGTEYSFKVEAGDAADNWSSDGPSVSATTVDSSPYWPPGVFLEAINVTETSLTLVWQDANDDVGVTQYKVCQVDYPNDIELGALGAGGELSFDVTGLEVYANYEFYIQAGDAADNWSDKLWVSVQTLDLSAPVWRQGSILTATDVTKNSLTLYWDESDVTDNVAVRYYLLYLDDELFDFVWTGQDSYYLDCLMPGTTFNFKVEASDPAGNASDTGPTLSVTTVPGTSDCDQLTERVNVSSDGEQTYAWKWDPWGDPDAIPFYCDDPYGPWSGGEVPPCENAWSFGADISADGRFVSFYSNAVNLSADDNTPFSDVFVHDRQTGVTELVSLTPSGEQFDYQLMHDDRQDIDRTSISADGRYVAFMHRMTKVYVHDRQTSETLWIAGSGSDGLYFDAVISDNGRYVAYSSDKEQLQLIDDYHVYVYDIVGNTTTRVSCVTDSDEQSDSGPYINGGSSSPSISADGRYVAFESLGKNLVPGDTNLIHTYSWRWGWIYMSCADIFVRDTHTKKTTRVSVSSSGAEANEQSWSPAISADGRYVAFLSEASNLVPNDTNGKMDVFVHDRNKGTTKRVSVSSIGEQANGSQVRSVDISNDGRFVTFASTASNLVPDDNNGEMDIFVHDCWSSQTSRVNVCACETEANGSSDMPSISADGSLVVFQSAASNLLPNVGDTNRQMDIFVHELQDTSVIADLAVTKSCLPDPVVVGANLTYTVIVTNNGPNDATGVVLVDVLSPEPNVTFDWASPPSTWDDVNNIVTCEIGELASGDDYVVTIQVTANVEGTIINAASVAASEVDSDPNNNTTILAIGVVAGMPDLDGDGVVDTEEQGPDGTDINYDGNQDGMPDSQQGNVASLHTVTGDYVTLSSPDGTTLTNVQAVDNPSPADAPDGVEFPYGFLEFTINGVGVSGAATGTLILPDGASPTTYWKYGPTPDDATEHWYEFKYDGLTGAEINGNIITLHFVDGQRGDDDITANGSIVEPGGPGEMEAIPGDLDGDSDVDRDDLNIILSHRNQPANVCPECDLDGDGMITALDARKLVLLCTRPRCACE